MTDGRLDLKFVPLHLETATPINSIRLVFESGRPAITALNEATDGAPLLSIAPLFDDFEVGPFHPLFKLESPFGAPLWDIQNVQNLITTVWTKPGSAISALGYRAKASVEKVLTGRYPSGVFQNPRFVRGQAHASVTAIAYKDAGSFLAVFDGPLEAGNSPYSALPPIGTGVPLDGLMLRHGNGYLLFTKMMTLGPRERERKDLRGESIQPGILRCLRLNVKFEPTSDILSPIGDTAIFEFDADISAGSLFLLATTKRGYLAAMAVVSEQEMRWTVSSDVVTHIELLAPSVLATDSSAIAAAIGSAAQPSRRLFLGRY